jgi:uncharacterized membrane protein
MKSPELNFSNIVHGLEFGTIGVAAYEIFQSLGLLASGYPKDFVLNLFFGITGLAIHSVLPDYIYGFPIDEVGKLAISLLPIAAKGILVEESEGARLGKLAFGSFIGSIPIVFGQEPVNMINSTIRVIENAVIPAINGLRHIKKAY